MRKKSENKSKQDPNDDKNKNINDLIELQKEKNRMKAEFKQIIEKNESRKASMKLNPLS